MPRGCTTQPARCLPNMRRHRSEPEPGPGQDAGGDSDSDDEVYLPTLQFREPCLREAFMAPPMLAVPPRLVLVDDDDRTVYSRRAVILDT